MNVYFMMVVTIEVADEIELIKTKEYEFRKKDLIYERNRKG